MFVCPVDGIYEGPWPKTVVIADVLYKPTELYGDDIYVEDKECRKPMNAYDYQKAAMRTASKYPNLTEAAMGISGEAGEVVDIIKKHIFHEHELDTVALKKELGDLLWYIALTCEVTQIDLDDVMEENIEKLKKRYPDGFDPERSKNRESDDI